jgi:hypothetical protein
MLLARTGARFAVLVVLTLTAGATLAGDAPPAAREDLNTLSLEVAALQLLNQLDVTPSQMEALAKMAKGITPKEVKRQPAKTSDKYRQTLRDLRDALVQGDQDKIDELNETLDDLKDSEKPELDDDVEITDEARSRAPETLRLLSARQTASYLGLYGDDLPDPAASLRDALEKAPRADEKEWKELRDDTVEEVGWLVAGLDVARAHKVSEKAGTLLDRAHKLKPDEFKEQRAELEKAAREVLGDVGPLEVLRHVLERDLAELLSNPQLRAALDARLKQGKK